MAVPNTEPTSAGLLLQRETLQWCRNHVQLAGDTDIFPVPLEFGAVWGQWSQVLQHLSSLDIERWRTNEFRRCLTPKSRFGFRIATQLHPLDTLIFSGLVYEIARDLERVRVPKSKQVVFSHRVKRDPSGRLYDSEFNFDAFRYHLRSMCERRQDGWVVATDIADFYPRIYHHPLENALRAATSKQSHVDAIMRFLSEWNFSVSYGIPVGPAATRLLAEVAIADVDSALHADGIEFCRFSDDYRIFASSERDAHRSLTILANVLFENHGLTLSEHKTEIVSTSTFEARFLHGTRPLDSASLARRVTSILEEFGAEEDRYASMALEELPVEVIQALDELDLNAVLREQVEHRVSDNFAVSIALRRLAQLEDATSLDLVLESLDRLGAVMPQVARYLVKVCPPERNTEVGQNVLQMIREGVSGHLEYQRVWLLSLFADSDQWNCRDELVPLLEVVEDEVSRPMLIRALGTAGHQQWFRSRRRRVLSMNGWERRAFIEAAGILNPDEYIHWLRSLLSRLDELDGAVARNALQGALRTRAERNGASTDEDEVQEDLTALSAQVAAALELDSSVVVEDDGDPFSG